MTPRKKNDIYIYMRVCVYVSVCDVVHRYKTTENSQRGRNLYMESIRSASSIHEILG